MIISNINDALIVNNQILEDKKSKLQIMHCLIFFKQKINYLPGDLIGIYTSKNIKYYSIASYKYNPISILLNNKNYNKLDTKYNLFKELKLKKKNEYQVFIKKTSFKLPKDPNVPIIMICNGTGIAPFISFLNYRINLIKKGPAWLFFGCYNNRCKNLYFYPTMLKTFLYKKNITKVSFAFSKTNNLYIQDKIQKYSNEIWKWINIYKCYLYICGGPKDMVMNVENILLNIIKKYKKNNYKQYFLNMKQEKRYQTYL